MKYILHDTNASDDEKLAELLILHGCEGYGLFWLILEKIGKQEKPIKTTVLKKQLKVGKKLEKAWSFMETIGLISSNNGDTFNKQLLNFSEKYKIKSEKNKKRISEWREKQQDIENVTHSESVRNTPKVNRSKVKESNILNEQQKLSFDEFWEKYQKKAGKQATEKLWHKLTDQEIQEVLNHVPKYVLSTPDPKYRKDPESYLRNKRWQDEIITTLTEEEKDRMKFKRIIV